ncbi:MAG: alpha-amylase family glycosyl hydrolase [Chthoniobacterales bacterium]|jgi:glycosidase
MRRPAILFFCVLAAAASHASPSRYDGLGADDVRYLLTRGPGGLEVRVLGAGVDRPEQAVFVALGKSSGQGSPLVPSEPGEEGAPVWLPFAAEAIVSARRTADGEKVFLRRWSETSWAARQPAKGVQFSAEPAEVTLLIPPEIVGAADRLVVYLKDLAADEGRGRLYGAIDRASASGTGEQTIRHYLAMDGGESGAVFRRAGRTPPGGPRTRIYQLLPRLFGNTNETRKPGGTIEENGTGKFSDINEAALAELKALGFTHLWLTGVLQQATATDYADIGEPSDDPDLLKGRAGSPYAIRDYFDVSPDYADDPAERKEEFKALIDRIHAQEMKVLIDFVPNHVARSYSSSMKPELSFGADDDRGKFFDSQNNFFYLTPESGAEGEAPLRLPTLEGVDGSASLPGVDGLYEGEKEFGRVTGDDTASWAPGRDRWYETVKLNYGWNFADPEKKTRSYPHGKNSDIPVPDTWKKMDEVIAYWQGLGVDGFRADMAHMVPPEFWQWLIVRARERNPGVFFVAEAYAGEAQVPSGDREASAVTGGDVMLELLKAGFDAVYDDPGYDALKEVFDGTGTANALDEVRPRPFLFDNSLRYAENHDEVRLASPREWGGHGMAVGKPVSALLFGLSRGPVMLYHGQEVGEPALGAEGHGGDDARTSIYDYWSMPEFAKWVNGGKFDGAGLSPEQKSLREFYRRLLHLADQPALRDGDFYPLNPDNADNPAYGPVSPGTGGAWLYAYLRHDRATGQRILVVANLNPEKPLENVRLRFSRKAMRFLGWDTIAGSQTVPVLAGDRLGEVTGESAAIQTTPAEMENPGLGIKELQPLTAAYYELQSVP